MKKYLITTLILLGAGVALYALASSSGPNSTQTVVDDATVGTVAWTNPTNATTSDGIYATGGATGAITHYLKATNFGFSIPVGATINGILVEIQRRGTTQGGYIAPVDSSVKIVKSDGTFGTTDKADTITGWPNVTESYASYGSSTDLWGETWASSDINNSNFGVGISAKSQHSGSDGGQPEVDFIRITITYTPAASTIKQFQISSGKVSIKSGKMLIKN